MEGTNPPKRQCTGQGKSAERFIEEKALGNGKWIALKEFSYKYGENEDGTPQVRTWEVVKRTSTPKGMDVDGCQIIPIIKEGDRRHLLLISCYRPPVDKFVLELPGGKINSY